MKQLPIAFFRRDTTHVAEELLGKIISFNGMSARIVETEAYGADPASHAYTRTARSALMYDTFAHVYVYLIYGMYNCINFTTERTSVPGAVLIRALEPLSGLEQMKQNRKTDNLYNLCSGPGKLCAAFGIDRKLNGTPLGKHVLIHHDGLTVPKIATSSRIGIKDALDLQWRYYIDGNRFVSKG